MGAKRPSMRTLPDGSKVWHHPPDEQHPDGMLTLIHDCSPLRERHDARLHEHRRRHQELKQCHHDRIRAKRAAQSAQGLPPEKSPL